MPKASLRLLLLMACSAANAAEPYTPQLAACLHKAGGVTPDIIDCIGAETKVHDARLNESYKALMATLSEPRKKELLEVQRAWLKYRELNCKFYFDPNGGTIARVEANDCFLKLTAERAVELKSLIP
jgi:uncharacterized protein YecT (DUF1311 family)